MRRSPVALLIVVGCFVTLSAPSARGDFHFWQIQEIFSNPAGNIQYIELHNDFDSENVLEGHTFRTNSNVFTYPNDLPGASTADTTFLMATADFAALPGNIAPDYVIPPNFFSTSGDTLNFANVDFFTFTGGQLPQDGRALNRFSGQAVDPTPTNFAGETGFVPEPAALVLLPLLVLFMRRQATGRATGATAAPHPPT